MAFALGGSLSSGSAYLCMRKIGQSVHSSLNPLYFGVFSSIVSVMIMPFAEPEIKEPLDAQAIFLLIVMGLFGWAA